MRSMYPKEFIQNIYIGNVGELVAKHYYYICFGLLGTGIEFLGKCINEPRNPTWHLPNLGKENFDMVLTDLMTPYAVYKDSFKLADSLRNGMAHAFQPKNSIEMTHQAEADRNGWLHLHVNSNNRLVLVCEALYADFKSACEEVIKRIDNRAFVAGSKMYNPFLEV